MKQNFLKRWRKKAVLKYIPSELNQEPFYKTLENFNDDLPYIIVGSSIDYYTKITAYIPKEKIYPDREDNLIQNKTHNLRYSSSFDDGYDATFKIVLFGDVIEGRSVLTQRFLTNLFLSDSKMTIGVDFEVKSLVVDESKVKLQIWDFDVEERFRFLLPAYVRGSRGGIFLYNVNDESSLYSIGDWLSLIKKEIKESEYFPIIVVGIVTDIENKHRIPAKEAIEIAKLRGTDGFLECSVKTGKNIDKAFEALTMLMLEQF